MPLRKNLVIVRAGDASLHEQWLDSDEERNWDIIVNYFGDDPERYRRDDVRRIDSKSVKWPALHDLIRGLREEIICYDRVWFPDDDLAATKAGINSLFEIAERHELVGAARFDVRQLHQSPCDAAKPVLSFAFHEFHRDHGAML